MTGFRRLAASMALSTVLSIETATLICAPLGLDGNWWIAATLGFGILWMFVTDRAVEKADAAWAELRELSTGSTRDNDGPTLLALFAMHNEPVRLFDVVLVLSPCPESPSWLHPLRRWNVIIAWVRRQAELEAEARGLSDAGLLRCTERARVWNNASMYEATGLGRDVAARNAEVLMAGRAEERA